MHDDSTASIEQTDSASAEPSAYSTTYDDVPYASYAYFQSHPNRLSVVATLFGMTPAPLANCRVLELGSASGGNLLPMAEAFPDASFIGLDYSSRQIADGVKIVEKLGLRNIELRCQSILDVGSSLGKFDYIICHGVYSWVPETVRQKILDICVENLNPQGVAYVSYNTYPGWHLRGTVREMMLYHVRRWEAPDERVTHARALLDFLVRVVPQEKTGYALLLRAEMERLRHTADNYVLHEHLESVNEPIYFHQFAEAAAAKGLQFLAEAQSSARKLEGYAEEAYTIVSKLSRDIIEYEQYLDFLQNRTFRQTLLCHKDIVVDRDLKPKNARNLYVASPAVPQTPVNLHPDFETAFKVEDTTIRTKSPLLKTALHILGLRWPEALSFSELLENSLTEWRQRDLNPEAPEKLEDNLALNLIHGFTRGIAQLYATPPSVRSKLDGPPRASALARLQAVGDSRLTTLLHTSVMLNDTERAVLQLADGTRTREEILERLLQDIRDGRLTFNIAAGQPQPSPGETTIDVMPSPAPAAEAPSEEMIRAKVSELLDKTLFRLTQFALMCA